MVQLSPSPVLDLSPTSDHSEEVKVKHGSPKLEGTPVLSSLQLALASSTTTYQGYETYIEDGLICLKHKIRNIEKKKLKLEDYKQRLKDGNTLNEDQLEAVEKYDEVVHNLAFARELQKTFSSLSQDLLKAQRKAVRREQVMKMEADRKRLRMVLQLHYIFQSLQQEHVRKDFRSGLNGAPFHSTRELQYLLNFSKLVGCNRDESMSLEDQMEQASATYWELLEGTDKPVAGTTYKHMKEQLAKLLDCGYFDHIPVPHSEGLEEAVAEVVKAEPPKDRSRIPDLPGMPKSACEVPTREFLNRRYLPETDFSAKEKLAKQPLSQAWKKEFLALKQQEPPDSWDMDYVEKPTPPQQAVLKPCRSAAVFVPKEPEEVKRPATEPKQRRERKSKTEQETKPVPKSDPPPVAVFNSPSSLPKDPVLRKQKLEDLMDQIQGSFSFMQDSVLEGEGSPTSGTPRKPHSALVTSTPIVQREVKKSQADLLPKALQPSSSPVARVPICPKTTLTNGEHSLNDLAMDLSADESAHEDVQLSTGDSFVSPPSLQSESGVPESPVEKVVDTNPVPISLPNKSVPTISISTSPPRPGQTFSLPPTNCTLSMTAAPFQTMHTVFKVNAPLPPRSDSDSKADSSGFSDTYNLSYSTASTQTPPESSLQPSGLLDQDDLQPATSYQSECPVSNGCQTYLSPGPQVGGFSRSTQPYYTRGAVRGGFDCYKNGIQSPGGSFIPQTYPTRECTTILYGTRETGYQQNYKRGGGPGGQRINSRATWSDSSQVSSPERDNETFASVDSGQTGSRCITPIDVPVTTQGPTLMPVHVYPLPQQMRVAFSAARTANFAPGTLDQPIVFDLLLNNLGETFDMQMGRFSCPVNGTYVFIFHILKLAVNVPLYVNLMRNEEVMVSAYANDGAPDHETASNHAVLQLYHGDQIWLRLHRGAIYGSSWKYSTFSGYLLYQD
ncbi:caprin-2 isoform X2 [Amia ocellicauda]|uniref:caprin-2 isoform X2 n=1 Tax=Amia ocellicauda TaxID=2972642 RepID=UPI00346424B7